MMGKRREPYSLHTIDDRDVVVTMRKAERDGSCMSSLALRNRHERSLSSHDRAKAPDCVFSKEIESNLDQLQHKMKILTEGEDKRDEQ